MKKCFGKCNGRYCMRLKVWKKPGFQINILFLLISIILLSAVSFSQVPTLDPAQTVNPATGEMGFSLPLGTVKGINGKDFPINLNYHAGIRKDEEASCVGLGFGVGPGAITRTTVYMPDENDGNEDSYKQINSDPSCEGPLWLKILQGIVMVITIAVAIVVTVVSCGSATVPAWVGVVQISATMLGIGSTVVSLVYHSGLDFHSGGDHIPQYNYYHAIHGKGGGFLKGYWQDLPDNYFLNTPYISGQIVWVGDHKNGHFVLKNSMGSAMKGKATIDIDYAIDKDTGEKIFKIRLIDGTLLIFDKTVKSRQYSSTAMYQESKGTECTSTFETFQKKETIDQWLLTKIIYPDYIDGSSPPDSDPSNSFNSNKGSWIYFDWDVTRTRSVVRLPRYFQSSENSITMTYSGSIHYYFKQPEALEDIEACRSPDISLDLEDPYLMGIRTPVQNAIFKYVDGRKDDLWFKESDIELYYYYSTIIDSDDEYNYPRYNSNISGETAKPINRKVLSSIEIRNNNNNTPVRTIQFQTSYNLRPNSFSAYTVDNSTPTNPLDKHLISIAGNPDAACLTLDAVAIMDANNALFNTTKFNYDQNKNYSGLHAPIGYFIRGDKKKIKRNYYLDDKDLWGYYCANRGTANDPNIEGDKARATDADAWSLRKVDFANGASIKWIYEPNCYDRANGEKLNAEGSIKYGGGIRVKEVIHNPGNTKPVVLSYFYTAQGSSCQFNELIGGSSGYCPVVPYNYLSSSDYRHNNRFRGGVYTPSKVAYEKVAIIKDYNSNENIAPYGYTIMEFTHAGDSDVQGYHPNGGSYGEIDSSCLRGLPRVVTTYNKDNKKISQTENEYHFIPQEVMQPDRIEDEIENMKMQNTVGWMRLVSKKENTSNVTNFNKYKYAVDMEDEQDKTSYEVDSISRTEIMSDDINLHDDRQKSSYCIGTISGAGNPLYEDQVLCNVNNRDYFLNIMIVSDFRKPLNTSETWNQRTFINTSISSYYTVDGYPEGYFDDIIGIELLDLDQNGNGPKNDLMIVFIQEYYSTRQVGCIIIKNIRLEGSKISYDGYSNDHLLPAYREGDFGSYEITSCAIGEFSSPKNNKPDLLFILSDPYNLLLDFPRTFIGYQDFDISSNTDKFYVTEMQDSFPGHIVNLIDNKKSGQIDLEVTGITQSEIGAAHVGVCRSSFRNISFDDNNYRLNIGAGPIKYPTPLNFNYNFNANGFGNGFIGLKYSKYPTNELNYTLFNHGIIIVYSVGPTTIEGDFDGQPNEIWTTTPNGKKLITKSIPAYLEYNGMKDAHILTPNCQTIVYEKTLNDKTPLSDSDVRSSQATTWSPHLGSSSWMVNYSFAWSDLKGSYTKYNFPSVENPPVDPSKTNPSWQLISTNKKFNNFSSILETKSAKGLYNTNIYRNDINLPIASIINARYDECGMFTCDYDMNEDDYFDKENGWSKAGATFDKDFKKGIFGPSVLVNGTFGPTKNIYGIDPYKDYVFSAYIYPKTTNPMRLTVEPHKNGSSSPSSSNSDELIEGLSVNKWQFVSKKITSKMLKEWGFDGTNDFLRIWVGNYPQDSKKAEFYLNDIRFYPDKASVITNYYYPVFQQIVGTIDNNNKPSHRITYDGFGRPLKWEKIDLKKFADDPGFFTTVKTRNYSDGQITISNPEPGKRYPLYASIDLRWNYSRETADLSMYFSNDGGLTWAKIASYSQKKSGENHLEFELPGDTEESKNCLIKIVDNTDNTVSSVSNVFEIVKNYLEIISPSENDVWWVTKKWTPNHVIKWISYGNISNVCIEYLDGAEWKIITSSTPNNGTYVWNTGEHKLQTGPNRLRISEAGTQKYGEISKPFMVNLNRQSFRRLLMLKR